MGLLLSVSSSRQQALGFCRVFFGRLVKLEPSRWTSVRSGDCCLDRSNSRSAGPFVKICCGSFGPGGLAVVNHPGPFVVAPSYVQGLAAQHLLREDRCGPHLASEWTQVFRLIHTRIFPLG